MIITCPEGGLTLRPALGEALRTNRFISSSQPLAAVPLTSLLYVYIREDKERLTDFLKDTQQGREEPELTPRQLGSGAHTLKMPALHGPQPGKQYLVQNKQSQLEGGPSGLSWTSSEMLLAKDQILACKRFI